MIPILIQFYNRKKNERTSRNEQNTYSVGTKYYFSSWDQIIVKDEVLYKCCTTTLGSTIEQPIVPEVMNNILNMCHCSLLSKHLGIKKTKVRFTRNFYWFALREDIWIFVISCDTCAINKSPAHKPKAPQGSMFFGDYIGPLLITKRKNRFIVVFMDYFFKWFEAFPVPYQTAECKARELLNEIISRSGCPMMLHSEQRRNYQSNILQEIFA